MAKRSSFNQDFWLRLLAQAPWPRGATIAHHNLIVAMKSSLFVFALALCHMPFGASTQNILVRQTDNPVSYILFSEFNLNSCTVSPIGAPSFGLFAGYSFTPNGDLYGLRGTDGKLHLIDEAQWTTEELFNIPTGPVWGDIAFTDDSTLYVIGAGGGPTLARVNVNTAEVELFYELALSGFALTVRYGQLYAATGDGIVLVNTAEPALSELVMPISPWEAWIEAMVTVPDGCGGIATYAFATPLFTIEHTLYLVDFDNQQLIEVCPLTFRGVAAASRHELGPPPCALALDPDAGAPGLSYAADTSCALLPLPLLADSFRLESEIGYLDSLRLRLSGALGGAAEYLSLAAADSLAVEGSGTGSLLLRPALGRPSLDAWRAALAAVRYHNEAQPLPQEGLREVAMQAFAAGNASDTAWALLPLFHTTPSAGLGGSIAFCPGDAPASLFAALGGSPAPGGAWQPGSGAFDPAADSPGEYLYIQTAGPGCPADTARLLVSLHAPPSFSLGPDTTLCPGQSLLLQAPDSLGAYLWSDGSSGPALLASQPGQYWLQAENSAGCGMAADTIELRYSDLAGAAILASPASCYGGSDGSLEAVPQGGLPPFQYAWSGGGGGNPLGGLPAGLYRLTLTDAAGCAAEAEAAVGQPAGPAIAEDSLRLCAGEPFLWQGQPIAADTVLEAVYTTPQGCDSLYRLRLSFADTVLVQEDAAICPGEAYSWEGLSLSRDTLLCLAFATAAGCDSLRCLRLAVRPGPALALPAAVEFCPGASVELDAGPQAGYQWSTGEQGRRIAVSAPGTYSVTVADAEGCTAAAAVQASAAPPLLADAGPDAEIARGEAAILQGSTNASGASIQWLPPDHLSCDTCLATEARPPQSQRYVLLVTDSLGCTASDEAFVAVVRRAGFALPNAFSPNGDGRNDAFGPLPASVTGMRVLSFRVFGRWGGLVHERAALPLGDPALYWDGTWRGSPAPAGVYVYTLEVEWPDGTREQAAGEVVLLR
jgi:gliding motility-associated-like protein